MEKSTGRFAKYFKKVLEEDMTAGDLGGGSFAPNASTSGDTYAPGDARVPKAIGKVQARIAKKKKKKRKEEDAEKKVSKTRAKCRAKAKRKYDVWPSAYASGYVQKCVNRGGNIK